MANPISDVNKPECLEPTQDEIDNALQQSRTYWHGLAQHAMVSYKRDIFPSSSLAPSELLKHVPSIPDNRVADCRAPLKITPSNGVLSLEGQATWVVAEDGDCGIVGMQKSRTSSLAIGVREPAPLRFGNVAFCSRLDHGSYSCSQRNMVGVLALGWLYILSAELVDREIVDTATISYTDSRAETVSPQDATLDAIDIGKVDLETARWWSAVLAPGQGWTAVILPDHHGSPFLSPWSTTLEAEQRLKIQWSESELSNDVLLSTPPSSRQAMEFLNEFCNYHGAQAQLSAALAVAITIPSHRCYGVPVVLPSLSAHSYARYPLLRETTAEELYDRLPYYMALSCNFHAVISSLCGMFWEPDVPCNLVSLWLHPVLAELPATFASNNSPNYMEILSIMCAVRRPSLAPLWLGAVLSDLAPMIVDLVRGGTPPLDPIAPAWTGCPQSFMDVADSQSYALATPSGVKVTRANVWRLLYLPPAIEDDLHYDSPPFGPWEPVGVTTFENSAIRVQLHQGCPCHALVYRQWSWICRDGSTVDEVVERSALHVEPLQWYPTSLGRGFWQSLITFTARCVPKFMIPHALVAAFARWLMSPQLSIPLQPSPDQESSIAASQEVFGWVTRNCEGHPPEAIYSDRWLLEDEGDDEVSEPEDDSRSGSSGPADGPVRGRGLARWIAEVMGEFSQ